MADYLKVEALKDIADAFESTTKVLVTHTKRLDILEGNVDDLFDLVSRSTKVARKATGNKRLLIVAVGVGVYVGYKLAEKDRKDNWRDVLRDKQPANAQPKNKSAENGKDEPQS